MSILYTSKPWNTGSSATIPASSFNSLSIAIIQFKDISLNNLKLIYFRN